MDATVIDLAPILDPLVKLTAMVVLGSAPLLANRVCQLFQQRLHVQLTEQQVKTVHDAADTAAGVLTVMLARGEMQVHDVHITDDRVRSVAQVALNAVPGAAGALGLSIPDLAHIIVGRVGKLMSADNTVQTLPPVMVGSQLYPQQVAPHVEAAQAAAAATISQLSLVPTPAPANAP